MDREHIKIIFIGDSGCGKSSIIRTFIRGYPDLTKSCCTSTENFSHISYTGYCIVNHVEYIMDIIDTNNDKVVSNVFKNLQYANSNFIAVCFSIGDKNSLQNCLEKWKTEIGRSRSVARILLVGLKSDLRKDGKYEKTLEKFDVTTRDDGLKIAETINARSYFECSAKLNQGVHELFESMPKILKNDAFQRQICALS